MDHACIDELALGLKEQGACHEEQEQCHEQHVPVDKSSQDVTATDRRPCAIQERRGSFHVE